MPIADRLTDGTPLSARLADRADRTPVVGGSEGFRSRFGLTAASSRLQALAGRLADRAERFFDDHGRVRLGALERMWPEERRRRAPWDMGGVYRGEMVLPERISSVDNDVDSEGLVTTPSGKKVFVPHRPVSNPWGKSLDAPAKVIRGRKTAGQSGSERRARDVVRRPAPSASARRTTTTAGTHQRSIPHRTRALDRAAARVDETSLLPAAGGLPRAGVSRSETRSASTGGAPARVVRPTPGASGAATSRSAAPAGAAASSRATSSKRPVAAPKRPIDRLTRPARTARLQDREVTPVEQAAARMATPGSRRGLRSVLRSSPSVELVATARPSSGATGAGSSGATGASATGPAESGAATSRPASGSPPTARAASRGVSRSSSRLSASPVSSSRQASSRQTSSRPTSPRQTTASRGADAALPARSAAAPATASPVASAPKAAGPKAAPRPASSPRGPSVLDLGTSSVRPAAPSPSGSSPASPSGSGLSDAAPSGSAPVPPVDLAADVSPRPAATGASPSAPQRGASTAHMARAAARLDRSPLVGAVALGEGLLDSPHAAPLRALHAAAARLDAPDLTGVAARAPLAASLAASPVARQRASLGDRAVSPRRFAVRKLSSGIFGPDRVVVAPLAPQADPEAQQPAAPRRHPGAPPPVVSGFSSASAGVASTTRVAKGAPASRATAPRTGDGGRPGPRGGSGATSGSGTRVARASGAAPSSHALRRLAKAGTHSSRSVLPAVSPDSSGARSAAHAGSSSVSRSPIHRAADRARAGSASPRSVVPSPLARVVGQETSTASGAPTARAVAQAASASRVPARDTRRRASLPTADTTAVVRPAASADAASVDQAPGLTAAPGLPQNQGLSRTQVASAASGGASAAGRQASAVEPASVRAASRAVRVTPGLDAVRRVLGAQPRSSRAGLAQPGGQGASPSQAPVAQAVGSRTGTSSNPYRRSGPISYARAAAAPVLRLDAATAESLGLFREGARLGSSGEWLAEGDLASAVQRAASRSATAGGRSGAARASSLRFSAPSAETVAHDLTASPAGVTPLDADFAGAPVVSGWGTSPGSAAAAPSSSPGAASAVRVQTAGRPLDWADDRTGGPTAGAPAARRRSRLARTASGALVPTRQGTSTLGAAARGSAARRPGAAGAASSASAVDVGWSADRPLLAGAAAQRSGGVRRSSAFAPDAVLPAPVGAPAGAFGAEPDSGSAVGSAVAGSSMAVNPALRASGAAPVSAGLAGTLQQVEQGAVDAHLPVWARRASGRPLIKGTPDGLVSALSRATSEEEVVRVLVEEGRDVVTASTLPKPVTEVIKQIRTEATAQVRDAQAQVEREQAQAGAPRTERAASRRASARVIRSMNTLRGGARKSAGVGPDQVSRLAKKLQGLIHLAEGVGDRDAARRQVRMAEDSAAARAEGQGGDSTRPDTGLQDQVDIDALSREVLEAVSRELELRRERRQEDSDGSFWW